MPDRRPTGTSRRRRLVAIAGHAGDARTARAHLDDDDATVRASALRSLHRSAALATADLDAAFEDRSPAVRRAAAELAATDTRCRLGELLDDADDTVVEVAAWALGEWGRAGADSVPMLERLALDHGDSLCREAAVASLGAIGDGSSLPTVIAALSDKATVRRRAVIALAAFEGPEVDAALRRALDDRDWQVRQVAEDLLGERGQA
ncbi:MAG: HEAT repeat domain-containing protein [Acidimicrobiia bacterium]|nr:HEAT repeat domain-containing protein [Acidimicrobiia bacterium]